MHPYLCNICKKDSLLLVLIDCEQVWRKTTVLCTRSCTSTFVQDAKVQEVLHFIVHRKVTFDHGRERFTFAEYAFALSENMIKLLSKKQTFVVTYEVRNFGTSLPD